MPVFNFFSKYKEYRDIEKHLIKKKMATKTYTSVERPCHLVSAREEFPIPKISSRPITITKVVSLYRLMNVLTIPGIDIFNACGNITSRITCQYLSPKPSAASNCPLGIACKPPRITSAMYPEENNVTMINILTSKSKSVPGGTK